MKKILWLLFAIFLFTNVGYAAVGTGTISKISAYTPPKHSKSPLPAGFQIMLSPHSPEDGPDTFITEDDVSSWVSGDQVFYKGLDSAHPCPSPLADTVLMNTTRGEWVCGITASTTALPQPNAQPGTQPATHEKIQAQ